MSNNIEELPKLLPLKPAIPRCHKKINNVLRDIAMPKSFCNNCGSPCGYYGNCYHMRDKCDIIKKNLVERCEIIRFWTFGDTTEKVHWCLSCGYNLQKNENNIFLNCINGCSLDEQNNGIIIDI